MLKTELPKKPASCFNEHLVWYGPDRGFLSVCGRFGKPCKRVKECPHKVGKCIKERQ
jgi:hypothetical protein